MASAPPRSRHVPVLLALLLLGLMAFVLVQMLAHTGPDEDATPARRVDEHLARLARDEPRLFGGLVRRDDDVTVAARIDPARWTEAQRALQRERASRVVATAPPDLVEALLALTRRATEAGK